MITGFNPADMYAAITSARAPTFPACSRHRRVHDPQGVRLVEGRRRGRQPDRPALDSVLLSRQGGLVVILHNDIDMPFAKAGRAGVS
jgi:hypothetical protein